MPRRSHSATRTPRSHRERDGSSTAGSAAEGRKPSVAKTRRKGSGEVQDLSAWRVAGKVMNTGKSAADMNRVVPIAAHAVAVFGNEQKASHWLSTPLALLGNLSPVQSLARGGADELIDQILTRIEYNIPS